MRRRKPAHDVVPDRLRRFRAADWDTDVWVAMHDWGRSRIEFSRSNPGAWQGDGFAPFAGLANVRARLLGRRRIPWPADDEGGR